MEYCLVGDFVEMYCYATHYSDKLQTLQEEDLRDC